MRKTRNMLIAALMLAMCQLMPLLFGQFPPLLKRISPMHIPVFLCGFICPGPWAAIVGFIAPVLRSVTFGVPELMPTAVAMSFELATYGAVTRLMVKLLPKGGVWKFVTMAVAMLAGRLVWGVACYLLYGISGGAFTMTAFLAGAFINAVPAILCHFILIPILVIDLEEQGYIKSEA